MDIEELYNVVFDDYGNIKVCGRQQTKQLILACQKIDSTMDFGDPRTGFMNIMKASSAAADVVAGAETEAAASAPAWRRVKIELLFIRLLTFP